MSLAFSSFVVSRKDGFVIRKCPFCPEIIRDDEGKEINFLVHLGRWSTEHQSKQEWADYIERLHLKGY